MNIFRLTPAKICLFASMGTTGIAIQFWAIFTGDNNNITLLQRILAILFAVPINWVLIMGVVAYISAYFKED